MSYSTFEMNFLRDLKFGLGRESCNLASRIRNLKFDYDAEIRYKELIVKAKRCIAEGPHPAGPLAQLHGVSALS